MHPRDAALRQFREISRSAADLPERRRLLIFEFELLGALQRAHDFASRSRALEIDLATVKDLLAHARRELSEANAHRERQERAWRSEIAALEHECEALDDLCRCLLMTIERAAGLEADRAAPTNPTHDARASA